MIEQGADKYLIRLKDSSEQQKYELVKQKITKHAKFFFDVRSRTLLVYDQTLIYILSKQETRVTDLGKQHAITQIIYHPIKSMLVFMTHDGYLLAHFINHKTQLTLKKDLKKECIFGWIYGRDNIDLFIAEASGVRVMKIQQEKKVIKEVKSISGKFNSFLYEPNTQVLVCFPTGDCKTVQTFLFDEDFKAKSSFKGPEIYINIENDDNLRILAKKNKSLGLHSSFLNYELFHKHQIDDFAAQVIRLNNKCYIVFYFGNEGKLKLYAVTDEPEKQVVIKLPSDCLPTFNVVDNMLVIHMNNEKITFIYDINNANAQMLVSPFPVEHVTRKINPYAGVFKGTRHIMPDGSISKWIINISVIFYYLKNQLQIFDFLVKREIAKPELLKWLRENLLRIKQINLSKFWKIIFVKTLSPSQRQGQGITLTQIYANVFYTLFCDDLTPKQPLLNIVLECIRQSKQMQIKIPLQLQKLLFDLLLQCKKYEILVFLCHSDIIKDSQQLFEALLRKAHKENEEILLTLAIDMANRVCKPQKVFEMLILSQQVWQARRYLKQNYENIQVPFMIHCAKAIQDQKLKQEFIKLTRAFILRKFPSMSEKYLNEAQDLLNQKKQEAKQENMTTEDRPEAP